MESEPSSAQATLAHYWDDHSTDTLTGAQEISATITEPTWWWTGIVGLTITLAIYWVGHYALLWRRNMREKAFQLELRRRHGIPDHDTRPFNVAYQEASIAAREAKRQSQSAQPEQQASVQNVQSTTSTANIIEGFRPQGRSRPPIPTFPGQPPVRVPSGNFTYGQTQPRAGYDSTRAFSQLPHSATTSSWGPGYDADGFRATSVPAVPTVSTRSAFAAAAASASHRSNGNFTPAAGAGEHRTWSSTARPITTPRSTGNVSQARARKRLYLTADEEVDEQQTATPNDKRSRTAGWGSEAMIDGDNEPLWAQSYPTESKPASDQQVPQIGKSKGKRLADDGEGDLRSEGKRRHTKSSKAHRPKASVAQETRGTKRERKEIDTASVLNDVMPVHKRGRAGDIDLSMVQEEDDVAEEEDDPTVSRDPMCGGRRIGQKWTSNGQEYMVGANGDRLRFTTVKESRKRYYMPADSKHADNSHMVEVFVEKWLTEEQYAKAKADGLLAWQENENLPKDAKSGSTEKALEGKENQSQEERPRAVSTTAITVSRIPQAQRTANTIWNTPGQSPLTTHPLTNPFNTPPSATTPEASGPRRVRYSMGTLPPTSTSNRAISVWEKQEKEAAALKILRERRKAEAAKNAPAPVPAPAPVATSAPAVTISAPPTESSIPRVAPLPAAVEKPSVSKLPTINSAAPASKSNDPAPTPAVANPFSFNVQKKDEVPKPSFSAAPAMAPPTSTPASLFPTQPTANATTVPAFGAKATPNSAAAPAPSPFGAPNATPATAPSTFGAPTLAAANKPTPFSFGPPSSGPKPAAPITNSLSLGASAPAASPFGATSSNPSPFGSTPAVPSPAATKPMGGFSFNSTPVASATTPAAPATSSSSLFNAPAPKPTGSGFSFNGGITPTNGTSQSKPTTSGFSFGTEAKPATAPTSSFGNTGATSSGFGNAGGANATNAFGNNTTNATSSGFSSGFSSNNNAAPPASSPFTFGTNKTANAVSTPVFGSQTSTTQTHAAPTFGAQTAAPVSSGYKFGGTNSASSATPNSGSSLQFGAPKPTLSIPSTNPFGAPSSATPTTTSGGGFTFGASTSAPAPTGAAASPATPSTPLFNLGAAASPVMGNRQISTSKRVQRAMSKPPQ